MKFESNIDRRRLLQNAGLLGAGAALAACTQPVLGQTPNLDVAILNFALNLEYLEAEFYLAAVGRDPDYDTTGTGTMGEVMKPANPVDFGTDTRVRSFALEVAGDEEAHVRFLRSAITSLGGEPVARPKIDITSAFAAAGSAASGGAIAGFSPYASPLAFLLGSFIFEDVGVTAYKGAAPLITNRSTVLASAAGILAVEAYHAGVIRDMLYDRQNVMVAAGLNTGQVVQAISNLRDSVDGTTDLDQGIIAPLEGNPPEFVYLGGTSGNRTDVSNLVPTDANALAFSRTPRQVLNIVYLAADAMKGGFFPNGVNGDFGGLL